MRWGGEIKENESIIKFYILMNFDFSRPHSQLSEALMHFNCGNFLYKLEKLATKCHDKPKKENYGKSDVSM